MLLIFILKTMSMGILKNDLNEVQCINNIKYINKSELLKFFACVTLFYSPPGGSGEQRGLKGS